MDDDRDIQVAWENWRFQVNSGWDRSNYFAVVETIALAGAWQLDQHKYPVTALFLAFLGLLSTMIWFLNDTINHAYILFWWRSTNLSRGYEKKAEQLGIGRWWSKSGVKYSHLMNFIPIIFGAAWLWLLGLHLPSPRCCYVLAMLCVLALAWGALAISKKVSDAAEKRWLQCVKPEPPDTRKETEKSPSYTITHKTGSSAESVCKKKTKAGREESRFSETLRLVHVQWAVSSTFLSRLRRLGLVRSRRERAGARSQERIRIMNSEW
jgi:hypothetical protein